MMAQATYQLLQNLIVAYDIPLAGARGTKVQDDALGLLSNDTSGRTNQFEVKARLDGIVEKCRILNNDPLGDALQMRLDQLPRLSNQWTPEILSLLLTLCDRPVQNARVEDLAFLERESLAAPLTWQDIIEEDPLEDQTAIWRDVEFAAGSSDGDGDVESRQSERSADERNLEVSGTEASDVDLEDVIVSVDNDALEDISKAQAWRERAPDHVRKWGTENKDPIEMTELMAIRETIFMLLGLPTSVFERDGNGKFCMRHNVQFRHTSVESVTHLLGMFIELGSKLCIIRNWIKKDLDVPLEQSFQFALETRMNLFHSTLHAIQERTMDLSHTVIVSLLNVHNEVFASSRLLVQLHNILTDAIPTSNIERPFMILQSLYSQTFTNQKRGDDEGYEYVARIFFQCFQAYLKPIQAWMETGEAGTHDPIMFIEKSAEEIPPQSTWQDQHRLLHNADGTLIAPRFLHVAGKKIFNTGKSVDFLKKLGIDSPMQRTQGDVESLMTYETVCLTADPRNLSPFSDLFDAALVRWIASKHRSSSLLLRDQLESRCGLHKSLNALEHIYFYFNGALSNSIVYPLFERIDLGRIGFQVNKKRGKKQWNDVFIITELFHEAFAAVDCVELARLNIHPCPLKQASDINRRSMDILEKLSVSYILPWPVANVIRPQSMATYQHIFVFLTQIERARFLLQRNKLPANISSAFYAVRCNLLWFVNTLSSHLTTLVIAVNTAVMRHDIAFAEDVDAMIAVHQIYIAKLEDQCFLSKNHASLRQAVLSILDLAVLFSDLQPAPDAQEGGKGHSKFVSLSDEDEDEDEDDEIQPAKRPIIHSAIQTRERLLHIHETYSQLLSIVTAAVEGISKANGGQMWVILAGNLAFGGV